MTRQSRTTVFCWFAVMVADGLPAPLEVVFHPSGDALTVELDGEDAFGVWADALDAHRLKPLAMGLRTVFRAASADWNGYDLEVRATAEHAPTVVPPDEVFDRVREAAFPGDGPAATSCDEPR